MKIRSLLLTLALAGCSSAEPEPIIPPLPPMPTRYELLSEELTAADSDAVEAVELQESACYGYAKAFDIAGIEMSQIGKQELDSLKVVWYQQFRLTAARKMMSSPCDSILEKGTTTDKYLRPVYDEAKRLVGKHADSAARPSRISRGLFFS